MRVLRKYASIYRQYFNTCLAEAMTYRFHFVLLIVMDLTFYFTSFASVEFIFQHVDRIGPWNRDQFQFFLAFMLAVDQLHMTFISEAFWAFSEDIRRGQLDFLLVKPVNTLFCVFFRYIRPSTLLNAFVIWPVLLYWAFRAGVPLGFWPLIPFAVLYGFALISSLEMLLAMSMFWLVESFGINFLRMQFQQLSRWPDFVYQYFARKLFTVIYPVLLVGSAPVRWLLDRGDGELLGAGVAALIACWILIRILWGWGLRRYESASS